MEGELTEVVDDTAEVDDGREECGSCEAGGGRGAK